MRLTALLVTLILWSNGSSAQQPSSSADEHSSSAHEATAATRTAGNAGTVGINDEGPSALTLPVSLDKIREALSQPPPSEPLKGLNETPTFRLEIQERQKFEALMAKIKFDKGGPVVAGGRDAYEQQQLLFPRIDNPLVQPYGAFSPSEVMTLGVEALIEKYVAQKVAHVVRQPTARPDGTGSARRSGARARGIPGVATCLSAKGMT